MKTEFMIGFVILLMGISLAVAQKPDADMNQFELGVSWPVRTVRSLL